MKISGGLAARARPTRLERDPMRGAPVSRMKSLFDAPPPIVELAEIRAGSADKRPPFDRDRSREIEKGRPATSASAPKSPRAKV